MNLLEALFSGARALVREVVSIGRTAVREILKEIDNSSFGRAATKLVEGVTQKYFSTAHTLAEEERYLAEKAQRDGRRTANDAERLREIELERKVLRAKLEEANAQSAAEELRARADETLITRLDDDELSSNTGIISMKVCENCGGTMRICQGGLDSTTNKRKFYWQCTEPHRTPCPTAKLDPDKERANVIRPPDHDLDTPKEERRAIWSSNEVITETHGRVRQHLGDDDKQLICPHHLLPLKLLPRANQGGRVLDSYEYVCFGVTQNGLACQHKVELKTMPQVASMLRRTEGEGIIRH
jgi:hypothetical protein